MWLLSLVVALSVARGAAGAGAQSTNATDSKLYSIAGTVKAVSASSLSLEVGIHEEVVVVGIDSRSRLIGKGAHASDLLLRKPGPRLQDLIKVGDPVTVACRRSGRRLFAAEIRVVHP